MRFFPSVAIAAALVASANAAVAAPLFNLYNTGVDNAGVLLGNQMLDSHYQGYAQTTSTYNLITTGEKAVVSGYPIGAWFGYDGLSNWLSYAPNANAFVGNYDLRTTFDLTGYDLASVSISGKCSTDNVSFGIKLNGQTVQGAGCSGFNAWGASFSLTSGFNSGTNVLDFYYNNSGGPEGFRAEFFNVAGNRIPPAQTSVPEPGSMALLGLGLAGLSLVRRKSRKVA